VIDRGVLERAAPDVARALLGWQLQSSIDAFETAIQLTEVEAYTMDDPASHSFAGETARNRSMFGRAGTLYVYRSYGMHWCANVVTGTEGEGQAVLLRAGSIVAGEEVIRRRRGRSDHLADGPGKLCQALGITGEHDGLDLLSGGPVRLVGGRSPQSVTVTPRVGITKAAERKWRFVAED
jgi:DNA-3-methyladenine glycosylase